MHKNSSLQILHVLTLNTLNGDYGGPLRVARVTCTELIRRGYKATIFSGTLRNLEPLRNLHLDESFVHVSPILRSYPLSSLWSWRLVPKLKQKIGVADIVHIHFARDLIPILAALICIFQKKKFVTQTHGMIVDDGRLLTKLIDKILVEPILAKSEANFVLNEFERKRLSQVSNKIRIKILPNGIGISDFIQPKSRSRNLRVVFCARLHPQKGISKFLELATSQKDSQIEFQVFGPDGGEYEKIDQYLGMENRNHRLKYSGALNPNDVIHELSKFDILVLPSFNENFPMVVLEALSVGTCVLVMPSCGISGELSIFNENFVSESETTDGLIRSFDRLKQKVDEIDRAAVMKFCQEKYSIEKVCEELVQEYYLLVGNHDA